MLLERPQVVQTLEKFAAFYGTWRFIAAFTGALLLYWSWARLVQSVVSHPLSSRSFLSPEEHPLSFVRDCLFNVFTAPLHPQPEDTPCCGDKGPSLTWESHPTPRNATNRRSECLPLSCLAYRGTRRIYCNSYFSMVTAYVLINNVVRRFRSTDPFSL
jgi:hypothetical protein